MCGSWVNLSLSNGPQKALLPGRAARVSEEPGGSCARGLGVLAEVGRGDTEKAENGNHVCSSSVQPTFE